jgi:tRNA 2-selenouridine synthase
LPETPQPTQEMFESLLWNALRGYEAARPVYVEAESRRIGALRVPEALIDAMWGSDCVVLDAPLGVRVRLLKQEYAHFFAQAEDLIAKLERLVPLHGHAVIDRWRALVRSRSWDELTADLLVKHYDPAYSRAITRHYPALPRARRLTLNDAGDAAFGALAQRCLNEARTTQHESPVS